MLLEVSAARSYALNALEEWIPISIYRLKSYNLAYVFAFLTTALTDLYITLPKSSP